jgi:D-beta-D-heptose 7-phosphate kinase/D-beta-D-heptose 1-phosphate adenosyltransferase
LLARLRCRYVVITRGEHGMSLVGREGERLHIPSVARTVYDVSGAGDTVIAVLALGLSAGASIELAMQLANFAAGAVVGKLGTATATASEIIELVQDGA